MHRRRRYALLAATALVAAACGNGGDGGEQIETADTPAEDLEANITVWAWNVAAGALDGLVPAFNEEYPNVQVTVEDIGRLDVYDRLTVGLEAGTGLPDVVAIETDRMPTFVNAHPQGFVDLGPLGADEHVDDLSPSQLPQSEGPDGELFSIPWDGGPAAVFYRTDLFEEAGVDADSIETWDDYLAAGEQILEATGTPLLSIDMPSDDGMFRTFTQQQGSFYFDENGDVAVASDEAVRTMTFLQDLAEAGLVSNDAGWDGLVTANISGEVASQPNGVWWSGTLEDEASDMAGQWGVFELPAPEAGGNRASNLGGSTLAVPAASENQEAAWRFVEFALLDAENQAYMLDEWGLFPSYLPSYDEPVFSEPRELFGGEPIFELFADTVEDIPEVNYTEDFSEAQEIVINAQADILLEGADPETRLQEAAELIASQTGRDVAE
ncbi:ABC transporter substrate-binding protein [Egicoccus halophilus]|uniref:ABC transporter substrate-binding protein n=2 Tax=Egicoccus halophilus TaxID=1670830 RepID=A0A8J3AAW2_9ACTN|nr:ABC transporter substrate-binding protein [Egicoccus halophilus]